MAGVSDHVAEDGVDGFPNMSPVSVSTRFVGSGGRRVIGKGFTGRVRPRAAASITVKAHSNYVIDPEAVGATVELDPADSGFHIMRTPIAADGESLAVQLSSESKNSFEWHSCSVHGAKGRQG